MFVTVYSGYIAIFWEWINCWETVLCYYAEAPVFNTPVNSTADTISLSWTQPGNASGVDSYTVSYTYTIRQCGPGVMSGSQRINGSVRRYNLSGLEEDSDYNITLTANTATGSIHSIQTSVTTSTAGMYNIYMHSVLMIK